MKKVFIIIFSLIISFSYSNCRAQEIVKVSKPILNLNNNNVTILFDILNGNQADRFNISLEVTDSTGKQINAQTLTGDIGDNVSGGSGKEIAWNLTVDNVVVKAMLYFQVSAKLVVPEKSIVEIVPADNKAAFGSEESSVITNSTEANEKTEKLSRSGVVSQSLLLPGLGLTRINNGDPHWLKGVAGYSCITASLIYNSASNKSYTDYQQSTDLQDRDDLFNTSTKQKNISNTFLYSAIGVWVIDFIWTLADSKELSKDLKYSQTKGLSFNSSFNGEAQLALLSLRYNF